MELRAGLAVTEDEVPHDNDPRTAVMRTIHSSKFSTENSLRQICSRLWMSLVLSAIRGSLSSEAKQWLERTRVRLMRSGSVVGSLWTPLLIRPRLWRSLPLFPVKKFNGQEMDGRTLKVEIAKSGAPAAKTAGTAAAAGAAVATRTEKWWSELDDAG
jgi:hypothetical protein